MEDRIKDAEARIAKLRLQLNSDKDRLQKMKDEALLPILKKKYGGKYWKYDNGVSKENRWWLYSHCRKVLGEYEGLFDSFESTTANDNENVFKHNFSSTFSLCQVKITKRQYEAALGRFTAKLQKIILETEK